MMINTVARNHISGVKNGEFSNALKQLKDSFISDWVKHLLLNKQVFLSLIVFHNSIARISMYDEL